MYVMDGRHAKIAISIPARLLERLERLREREGAATSRTRSRSRMIRGAVEQYVVDAEREEMNRAVREAYARVPETKEELEFIDAMNRLIAPYLAEELPWDGPVPERPAE